MFPHLTAAFNFSDHPDLNTCGDFCRSVFETKYGSTFIGTYSGNHDKEDTKACGRLKNDADLDFKECAGNDGWGICDMLDDNTPGSEYNVPQSYIAF